MMGRGTVAVCCIISHDIAQIVGVPAAAAKPAAATDRDHRPLRRASSNLTALVTQQPVQKQARRRGNSWVNSRAKCAAGSP
jgi:hypothetical protein